MLIISIGHYKTYLYKPIYVFLAFKDVSKCLDFYYSFYPYIKVTGCPMNIAKDLI